MNEDSISFKYDLIKYSVHLAKLLNAVDCWPNGELLSGLGFVRSCALLLSSVLILLKRRQKGGAAGLGWAEKGC